VTLLQRRFKAVIERLGDTFTVGGTPGKALVAVLPFADAQTYLTSAEITAAAKPIHAMYVPFDDATATAAAVDWNSLTLTVLRAVELRLQDESVLRMLIVV
jgi:hypothetical protein